MNLVFYTAAPRPDDEEERQAAVDRSGVLNARDVEELQAIVREAAELCGTPLAGLTVLDRDRQHLVAVLGLETNETSRSTSFCGHAIMNPKDVLCVPDAAQDERFAGNPMVLAHQGVRFYAGAPVLSEDGYPLGALCAVDVEPHAKLPPATAQKLRLLAARASDAIARLPQDA